MGGAASPGRLVSARAAVQHARIKARRVRSVSRKWNFSAGPATLPAAVLEQARAELLDWRGEGVSVMEVSHRGAAFARLAAELEADLRRLLQLPPAWRVLLLHGGATQHFAQIPLNFARPGERVDYVVTGHWSIKAMQAAAPFARVHELASNAAGGHRDLPSLPRPAAGAAYVHIVENETIHGVEFPAPPDCGAVPLIADLSSSILSRPLDLERYALVYAGAQKNIGPSGLVLMLVHEALLERPKRELPEIFDYAAIARRHSLLNTPNTWAWHIAALVCRWLLAQGGVAEMERRSRARAALLYAAIDDSGDFYRNTVAPAARSRMNVPFSLPDAELEERFLAQAAGAGLVGLKGHRSLGGMRASLYNAMPLEGVRVLTDFMREFARRHG